LILGLDVSTSTTGYCVLDNCGNLVMLDAINLSRHKTVYDKAVQIKKAFSVLKEQYEIKQIFVEENLQAFRPGFSSAKTILTLAKFNGITCLLANQEFGIEPIDINVNVARKTVDLKILRGKKTQKNTKQQVFEWVNQKIDFDWPIKVLKSGPRKGESIYESCVYDMADAFVIARAGFKMNNSS